MTAIALNTVSRSVVDAMNLRGVLSALRDGIDAFAAYRMQRAVPEHELRRVEREVARFRQLMRAGKS